MKQTRGVSFEEIAYHIGRDEVLDVRRHPNLERYPDQKIFVIELADYVYLVPFVEDTRGDLLEDDHPEPQGQEGVSR